MYKIQCSRCDQGTRIVFRDDAGRPLCVGCADETNATSFRFHRAAEERREWLLDLQGEIEQAIHHVDRLARLEQLLKRAQGVEVPDEARRPLTPPERAPFASLLLMGLQQIRAGIELVHEAADYPLPEPFDDELRFAYRIERYAVPLEALEKEAVPVVLDPMPADAAEPHGGGAPGA